MRINSPKCNWLVCHSDGRTNHAGLSETKPPLTAVVVLPDEELSLDFGIWPLGLVWAPVLCLSVPVLRIGAGRRTVGFKPLLYSLNSQDSHLVLGISYSSQRSGVHGQPGIAVSRACKPVSLHSLYSLVPRIRRGDVSEPHLCSG